jgi:hypothetical protein
MCCSSRWTIYGLNWEYVEESGERSGIREDRSRNEEAAESNAELMAELMKETPFDCGTRWHFVPPGPHIGNLRSLDKMASCPTPAIANCPNIHEVNNEQATK